MDFYLLRPVSSQFLVSLRRLTLAELVNALIGLALAIYAGSLAGVHWTVVAVVQATVFVGCGIVLLYAVWFLITTVTFWLVRVDTIDALFYSAFEAARYPVSYFKGYLRAMLTIVFPVAFATTVPAEALPGRADGRFLVLGMALALFSLIVTHRFWTFALRHYSSASS